MSADLGPQRAAGWRRLVLLGTPPAFAALTLFHPAQHPGHLEDTTRWMTVHVGQLVLSVLLAYCVWFLLEGIPGRAAAVARGTLPVFLVFFSAFDAVAGLATGWLAGADHHGVVDAGVADQAITELFDHNWLAGNASVTGGVGGIAWAVVAVSAAVALRGAGADRLTVSFMAASLLFMVHPPPFGTLGLLALSAATLRWDRQLRRGRPRASDQRAPEPASRTSTQVRAATAEPPMSSRGRQAPGVT
jgi:hypothetical protein